MKVGNIKFCNCGNVDGDDTAVTDLALHRPDKDKVGEVYDSDAGNWPSRKRACIDRHRVHGIAQRFSNKRAVLRRVRA